MIRFVYDSEKTALRDLGIVLGYPSAPELSEGAQAALRLARQRLGALPGSDVVDLLEKMQRSGLTPSRPEPEARLVQERPDRQVIGRYRS
jgi:hypothetical protein